MSVCLLKFYIFRAPVSIIFRFLCKISQITHVKLYRVLYHFSAYFVNKERSQNAVLGQNFLHTEVYVHMIIRDSF